MNNIVLLDPKQDSDFITKYYNKYNLEIDTTTVDHVVARTFHDLLFYAMRYNNYHHEAKYGNGVVIWMRNSLTCRKRTHGR